MTTYYIGADVHSNSTELAIEKNQKIVQRYKLPTSIAALSNVLDSLKGEKHLAIEEGPMAGWLYRNLSKKVDELIICDPRRNKLIDSDGDKDDKIDAAKLACLLRGNFLRPVYHSDDQSRADGSACITTAFETQCETSTRFAPAAGCTVFQSRV